MLDMMLWSYRDDNNCWDYVRYWLIKLFDVPEKAVPKYGIIPNDKKSMTKAYKLVRSGFSESEPTNGAVACQYRGRLLDHVGLVYNHMVYHVKDKSGVMVEPLAEFIRGKKVVFYAYQRL